MFDGDIECKSYETSEPDSNHDSRITDYNPMFPANAPVVLTFIDITVTTKGEKKKTLLKNISGSITGGFWAIMGERFMVLLTPHYNLSHLFINQLCT